MILLLGSLRSDRTGGQKNGYDHYQTEARDGEEKAERAHHGAAQRERAHEAQALTRR